jgi:hypothetical protein
VESSPPQGSTTTPTVKKRRPRLVRPRPRVRGIRMAQRFSASRGPQLLQGTVKLGSNGLGAVKIRLWRHYHGGCWYYSGAAERLVESACGKRELFSVGTDAEWSYLLPFRLPPGHYVLDVLAYDRSGRRSVLQPRVSRLSFHVKRVGQR